MEKQALHVSIVGSGIGGLAAAAALQHQGTEVALFEIGQWENPLLCSLRDGLTPLAFAPLFPRLFVAHVSLPS